MDEYILILFGILPRGGLKRKIDFLFKIKKILMMDSAKFDMFKNFTILNKTTLFLIKLLVIFIHKLRP